MKRSHAKKSLAEAINLYITAEKNNLDSEVLAEIVLTHCESVLAMLPPDPPNYKDWVAYGDWEMEDEA